MRTTMRSTSFQNSHGFLTMELIMVFMVMVMMDFGGVEALHTNYDPLKEDDFCRRHSHATAIIGDRLYIDGGYINTKITDPKNYTMTHLLYLDLENDSTNLPALAGPLSKPEEVPRVAGGQLWADQANGRLFMYGGEFPGDDKVLPIPRGIWTYDAWNNTWELLQEHPSTLEMGWNYTRPSFGAGAVDEVGGKAYSLGGWVGEQNDPDYEGPRTAQPGMVIYNMVENRWKYDHGPTNVRKRPRVEGVLLFVPAGDKGLLVSFGGVYANEDGTVEPAPMTDIDVFDIAQEFWYYQRANGTAPESRRLFCAGAASASDGTSHNIYLYGGAAIQKDHIGYGDVYILTLPSFQWIKWYPESEDIRTAPHNSLSCNVVKGYQMIVMGGHFPDQNVCDVPSGFGVHNLDMTAYNEFSRRWNGYNKKEKEYLVPQSVIDLVGGTTKGRAKVLSPSNGWEDRSVGNLFEKPFTPTMREPTRAPPAKPKKEDESKKMVSIVVPIVVGGVILLGIIIGVYCVHRRRKQREQLLANPIGGGGNPAYPYVNQAGDPFHAGCVDHVTAFQLPTTQSPNLQASRFPPTHQEGSKNPTRSPFYQPEHDVYGQYRGHSMMGLTSPGGPTHLRSVSPQELPGEYYLTPTGAEKEFKPVNRAAMSMELSAEVARDLGFGVAEKLQEEKVRNSKNYGSPQDDQSQRQEDAPIAMPRPESFISQQPTQDMPGSISLYPHSQLHNRVKSTSNKALPPIPIIPEAAPRPPSPKAELPSPTQAVIMASFNENPSNFPEIPPPARKSSRRFERQTREERDMLVSGPYYPPTPTTIDGDSSSLMSMPTPTCETAGFARMMSPVAVIATNRMSTQNVNGGKMRRSGTERGTMRSQIPPVPAVAAQRHSTGEEPGVKYDSEGVRMV